MRRLALLVAGLALLAGVAATVSGGATQAEARWVITDLGTLGGRESRAADINGRGQIVGWSDTKLKSFGEPIRHAVIWQDGKITDLAASLPPRVDTYALAINDRGDIVLARDVTELFLWRDGKLTKLGLSQWSDDSLNERGQVIGLKRERGLEYAAVWDKGRVVVLGSLARRCRTDYGQSRPVAINERGQIIGTSATDTRDVDGECVEHAFLWEKGKMIDLGVLPGVQDATYPPGSTASGINERGQVVGASDTRRLESGSHSEPGSHAFLWQNGKMTDLGTLAKSRYDLRVDSSAAAINERGFVVGRSRRTEAGEFHATLWRGGKVIVLAPTDQMNLALNERTQVVGTMHVKGHSRGFVWQAGRLTVLGTLPGGETSRAWGINERGQVIGASSVQPEFKGECGPPPDEGGPWPCEHAVLWTLKR